GARLIDVCRRAPVQHMLGTLRQRRLEAHLVDNGGDGVAHNELRIAEHAGALIEKGPYERPMPRNLRGELVGIGERSETVIVGLAQQLDTTSRDQRAEALERFARV